MAMTLRLDAELDRQLDRLAREEHMSKHQVLVLAAREYVDRRNRVARTLAHADQVIEQNRRLLDRLGE